jgi:hypothetical protein
MDLIILIFGLALIGLLVWAVTTYIPMPPIFKTVITIIVAVMLILYLIRRFGSTVPNVMP